jgi:photosystem II stability/assembly factor-like uncharacterized protein
MKLHCSLIVLALLVTGCNISVTSFPASSEAATQVPTETLEPTPSPYPDTPAPPTIAAPVVDSPALLEVEFLNELDSWGVTETEIVRTTDGGFTWYDVTPPDLEETGFTVELFVLDRDHAWIQKPDFNNFPNNGLLYHTSDGGLNWSISSTPFSAGDLNFLDEENGWMLADLGVGAGSNAVAVFQTTDGGATWTKSYTNDPNDPQAADSLPLGGIKSDLVPLDMQTAWVGGVVYAPGSVYLYRTDDGGRTWAPVSVELPEGAEEYELGIDRDQMRFVSDVDGYLIVRMAGESTQTAVYTTDNGGETWRLAPTLIPGAGSSEFLSEEDAILYNGQAFHVTRDGGVTWVTVEPDIVFGDSFFSMDFVDLRSGWVISVDPQNHHSLYRTHDGGATWLPVLP